MRRELPWSVRGNCLACVSVLVLFLLSFRKDRTQQERKEEDSALPTLFLVVVKERKRCNLHVENKKFNFFFLFFLRQLENRNKPHKGRKKEHPGKSIRSVLNAEEKRASRSHLFINNKLQWNSEVVVSFLTNKVSNADKSGNECGDAQSG